MLTNSDLLIVGVLVGSTREGAFSQQLADRLAIATDQHLVPITGLDSVPYFNQDLEEQPPAAVEQLRAAVDGVDALVVVTPEYNDGMPGMLKNGIDWLSRPREASVLAGKPVAVIGNSPTPGGGRGAAGDVIRVLTRAHAAPMSTPLIVPSVHEALHDGSAALDQQLGTLLDSLTEAVAARAQVA